MSKKEDIGKLFSDRLKDFEKSPNRTTFEAIEALHQAQLKNKKTFKDYRFLIILVLLFLSSGTIYYLSTPSEAKTSKQVTAAGDDCNNQSVEKSVQTEPYVVVNNTDEEEAKERNNESAKNNPTHTNTISGSSNQNTLPSKKSGNRAYKKQTHSSLGSNTSINPLVASAANPTLSASRKNKYPQDDSANQKKETSPQNQLADESQELNTDLTSAKADDTTFESDQPENPVLEATVEEKKSITGGSQNMETQKDTLIFMKPLKEGKEQRTRFSIHVAPYYNTGGNTNSILSEQASGYKEKGGLTLNYGATLSTYFTKKIGLHLGYNYLGLQTNTKDISGNDARSLLTDMQVALSPNTQLNPTDNIDIRQKAKYHEFSLDASYGVFTDKKIEVEALLGASIFVKNSDKLVIDLPQERIYDESVTINNVNSSLNVGANFLYTINKKLKFTVEPRLKFLFKNSSNNANSYKPAFFGIQTGFSYELD